MNDNNSKNSGGIGFCGLLALIFITLKLTHVIEWSWAWVLSPIWIPLALAFILVTVAVIIKAANNS